MAQNPQIPAIRAAVNGYKLSQLLITAEEIGLFKTLAANSVTLSELAQSTGTRGEHLRRLANALVSAGVLDLDDNQYKIADDWLLLNPMNPLAQGGYLRYASVVKKRWAYLSDALRTETVAKDSVALISGGDPAATSAFIDAMDANALPIAKHLASNWKFDGHTALDVGGGSAIYPIEIARRNADFRAIVFDLASVAPIAQRAIDRAGFGSRLAVATGSYHETLPDGQYDEAFLFAIIHQQDVAANEALLSRVKTVLAPGGRVFITSFFTNPEGTGPPFSAMFGVEMSVMVPGGRTYTIDEATALLRKAGFKDIQVHEEIPGPSSMLTARI